MALLTVDDAEVLFSKLELFDTVKTFPIRKVSYVQKATLFYVFFFSKFFTDT